MCEFVCGCVGRGIDCWTAGGCRAWINVSMSFNGSVSITTSIFCRMMRGWSFLMDRRVVTYFSVLCWRTGQNCVKSESGYSMSRGPMFGEPMFGEPMSHTFSSLSKGKGKGKGKAVPLEAWSGPEGSRKLRFPDFMTTAQDGGKVASLTHRYSFLLEAESTPGP